ncbi:hypothetical protein TNCT_528681 [Trichonephila clavata]|uniref:Uncharacterized protein n=1 Tax=Trichonephila clavata TaxID=2740835 RepID=A0A8X6J220_TRICU|nr:hypothetical protein TNCT_528681 [Trichonephila clavata]
MLLPLRSRARASKRQEEPGRTSPYLLRTRAGDKSGRTNPFPLRIRAGSKRRQVEDAATTSKALQFTQSSGFQDIRHCLNSLMEQFVR